MAILILVPMALVIACAVRSGWDRGVAVTGAGSLACGVWGVGVGRVSVSPGTRPRAGCGRGAHTVHSGFLGNGDNRYRELAPGWLASKTSAEAFTLYLPLPASHTYPTSRVVLETAPAASGRSAL